MADTEIAIDVCEGAIRNNARITALVASDEAGGERSVHYEFSSEESRKILNAVLAVLKKSNG